MDFETLQNFPAFIINVPELSPERGDPAYLNVKNAGYKNIILFKGVNGKNENEVTEALNLFNNFKFDFWCSKGNIGCNLSMLKVMLNIVDNNIEYATIFEDDIIFHDEWERLSKGFYANTPNNFDVIYMGNQIDECKFENQVPRINRKSCFCMHALIVSNKGAKKILDLILNWDYNSEYATKCMGRTADGITNCDIILKNYQDRILNKEINPNTFIWYCWNGTRNPCSYNKLPLDNNRTCRNTGMVFQNTELEILSNI
jgi:GR25 family glycosyltransferase involved in LPS biosynthesis